MSFIKNNVDLPTDMFNFPTDINLLKVGLRGTPCSGVTKAIKVGGMKMLRPRPVLL